MRKTFILFTLAACFLSPSAAPGQDTGRSRALEILPADGLDEKSVLVFRDQASLNPHYYLADETVLGLDKTAEAVFAKYGTGSGEALLLVVAYTSDEKARRVYERFCGDFFAKRIDPKTARTVERIETGEYAAALQARNFLIVVLGAPDRKTCEDLAKRAEERALGLY